MFYFKEKMFTSQKGHFSNFSTQELKKEKMPQNKEKSLFLNNLIYLLPVLNYMKHSNSQKFCQNQWTLMQVGRSFCLVFEEWLIPEAREERELHLKNRVDTKKYVRGD
jgi:hypothetical protein